MLSIALPKATDRDHSIASKYCYFELISPMASAMACILAPGMPGLQMTQQYIAGELSSLLAELRPAPNETLTDALDTLRREVERGPLARLPRLTRRAMGLTDVICWAALAEGDATGFCRYATGAALLQEFGDSADLLS